MCKLIDGLILLQRRNIKGLDSSSESTQWALKLSIGEPGMGIIIKSPQSGMTLCFQFVSAAAASAAMTFASHVKTV